MLYVVYRRGASWLIWVFLACSYFAAKTLVYEGWIYLDFGGIYHAQRARTGNRDEIVAGPIEEAHYFAQYLTQYCRFTPHATHAIQ